VRVWERGSREREGVGVVRMSELVRQRESGLNDVGPKNNWPRFNRPDRLSRPVRPVRPKLAGTKFDLVICRVSLN
jgi:hypothetical protein